MRSVSHNAMTFATSLVRKIKDSAGGHVDSLASTSTRHWSSFDHPGITRLLNQRAALRDNDKGLSLQTSESVRASQIMPSYVNMLTVT